MGTQTGFAKDARALARALLWATVAFFVIFFTFYSSQQYSGIRSYNETLEGQTAERVSYLSAPLTNFDFDLTLALAQELETLEGIAGISIAEQYGYELYSSIPEDGAGTEVEYELYKSDGSHLGQVVVSYFFKDLIAELPGLLGRAIGTTLMIVAPCAFAIYLILNSYVRQPLAQIDKAISATLATGDFTKAEYESNNAFGILAQKFNDMLNTLRVQHETLQEEQRLRELESEITSDVLFVRDMIIVYRTADGNIRSNFGRFAASNLPLIEALSKNPVFDTQELGEYFDAHPEWCKSKTVLMPELSTSKSSIMNYMVELPNGEHWSVSIVRYADKFDAIIFSNSTSIYLAEKEKAQVQKLEALGALTSGVAHDFNNLLAIIIGATEIELSMLDKRDANNLELIGQAAERARAIVNHLLTFSRKKPLERDTIALDTFLDEARTLFKPLLMADIELRIDCEKGVNIFANKDQLHVVLMNFAVNARHAMPHGGTLTIKAYRCAENERAREDLPEHDFAVISIGDTGTGMPQEVVERIFEPFFTTKANGKGTGLGLSMAYGFAQESGGKLTCTSIEGKGTTMSLYLPMTAPAKKKKNKQSSRNTSSLEGFNICVFDDETALLQLTKMALEASGASVIAFEGLSALEDRLAEGRFPCDAIITDNVMADARSTDIIKKMTEEFGHLPIIVASGLADEEIETMLNEHTISAFLQKPYSISDLRSMVSEVINSNGSAAAKKSAEAVLQMKP